MRRLMAISAFALSLAVPLWAQHGGGHAGGSFGGHAGFSGGHGGSFSGGGHVSSGMRSGPIASRGFTHSPTYSQRSYSHGPYLHDGYHGNHYHGGYGTHTHFYTYGIRNNCYGYACRGYGYGYGYPWAYGAYYDPSWWWDSGSSYDEDYERDRATANEMNQQSLEQQQMLRQEQDDGDQDTYARSEAAPRPAQHEAMGAPIVPDTVLVFRDQHKEEVKNYAIVGQTLWNFAPQRTQKIPLSDLDLPATTKANDDRGVTFHVPTSGEAQ